MEYVQGRIFTDPSLPSLARPWLVDLAAFKTVLVAFANLHAADTNYRDIGLGDYGRSSAYV
jgi:hypothetical protein